MLEVIENTGFDIIGGGVEQGFEVGPSLSFFSNWLNFGKYKIKKGTSGDCISREFGFYGQGLSLLTWKHIKRGDSLSLIGILWFQKPFGTY